MRPVFGASFIRALKLLDSGVAGALVAVLVLEMGFNWFLTQVKG